MHVDLGVPNWNAMQKRQRHRISVQEGEARIQCENCSWVNQTFTCHLMNYISPFVVCLGVRLCEYQTYF